MRVAARIGIGVICWIIGRLDDRYRWLAHYLVGNGKPMRIPEQHFATAFKYWHPSLPPDGMVVEPDEDTIFYHLVGSMTMRPQGDRIVGLDIYDWHPLCDCWSSVESPIPGKFVPLLHRLWPATKDHVERWVGEEHAQVRDSFWPYLGGTEFLSILDVPAVKEGR